MPPDHPEWRDAHRDRVVGAARDPPRDDLGSGSCRVDARRNPVDEGATEIAPLAAGLRPGIVQDVARRIRATTTVAADEAEMGVVRRCGGRTVVRVVPPDL